MHKLITLPIGLLALALAEPAFSWCKWGENGAPSSHYQVNVPASLTVTRVPVGGILASYSHQIPGGAGLICSSGVMNITFENGLEPSAIPNVYKTGVAGIGMRIIASRDLRWGVKDTVYGLPSQYVFDGRNNPYLPTYIYVEYVRTEIAVGSGKVPTNFTINFSIPDGLTPSTVTYTSSGFTNLENNFYFSSCEAREPSMTVQMGKVPISNIKSGAAPEKPFALDIRCRGIRPEKPVPVKIYFEGNSTGPGMLNLTRAGQTSVAQGVAIELKNDKGTKLPFDKPGAVSLDWQYSETDAEVYRFAGAARYTPSGGEIKSGKADATMTYVLDYN
ncbi:type 1 fimbrial protein [Pseudomonas chlororaphis]|uniref:Type 1 fimbrial protein n=1 Tax=Pseudomonas chlororaphis TaxID=587753 RepID=A0AB34BZJ3_9PSED|nr:fimbrial protein [Pseudomonas chlororaphis]KAA5837694.1 type 1 fimbrial protein [Pseudomonas chlororaphis]